MYAIAAIFGVPLLISGTMVNPEGLHLIGLINYTLIMLVLMPFGGGLPLLITQLILPTAGRTRLASVISTWVGGTLIGVAVIFWIASVLSYNPNVARVDWSAHMLIPFHPKTGIALGLFTLCQLIAWGLVGAISPILHPETAIRGAVTAGTVLFGFLYGAGWLLVS